MATEKRLIPLDEAIARVKDDGILGEGYSDDERIDDVCDILESCEIVDAVEVVHGHWEKTIDNCTVMHKCSVCGARVVKGFYEYENPNRYCYHCGAKMDGEKDSYGHNADKRDTVTYKGVVLPEPPKMDGERKDND